MSSFLLSLILIKISFGIKSTNVEYLLDSSHRPSNKYPDISSIPQELDWRWHTGQRYTTWTRNQNIPNYCNSGWAFSVTSSLSDRIMILNNNTFPEWVLSPQVLLKCDMNNQGCVGGAANNAYEYIRTHGISTEGCAPYQARGCGNLTNNNKECNMTGVHCSEISVCKSCWSGTCKAQYPYQLFYVQEYGNIKDENQILQALQDGPVVCGMCASSQFQNNFNDTKDKIFQYASQTDCIKQNHTVSIVGYGQQSNIKYWIVRNSYGQYWGYKGYFKIQRGNNTLGIEQNCSWATLTAKSVWINASTIQTSTANSVNVQHEPKVCRKAIADTDDIGWFVVDPLPQYYIKTSDLPTTFQWNDVNGTNYMTLPRNQRVPNSCESCWAHSITSALSDRMNIQRGMKGESLWPQINLSPQVLVNALNGCSGGNTQRGLKYICQHGIPHETCQQYVASNDPHGKNTQLNVCEICEKGNNCKQMAINNYTLYYVEQYGNVTGINNMKKEIYVRGPIECGIDSTSKFVQYTGGIFSQQLSNSSKVDHSVSIWGWSVDEKTGQEYWFGRNSWGQYWGEQGFFRLKMGSNLIETDCTWGVPTLIKPQSCKLQ